MKRPATAIKLPRPGLAPGSKTALRGSLSHMAGAILSDKDKAEIRAQFETATHITSVKVAGINAWTPLKAESVSRYIGELQSEGIIEEIRDAKGKFTGWQLTTSE